MPTLTEYEIHPAADLFPMMDAKAFAELKADIDANGVRECITLFDGRLIDGRNRYKAMRELGIDPACHAAELEECDDPISFVLSLNLHRRHLNETQRATVAAKIANMKEGKPSKDTASIEAVSQDKAADMLNVSRPSVQRARHAIDNGAPEVVEAMERGEIAASAAAKLVDVVPDKAKQSAIVKQGKEAVREAAKKKAKPAPQAEPETEPKAEPEAVGESGDSAGEFHKAIGMLRNARKLIQSVPHIDDDDAVRLRDEIGQAITQTVEKLNELLYRAGF